MTSKNITVLIISGLLILSSLALSSCCCPARGKIVEESRMLMGTEVQIKVSIDEAADDKVAKFAISKAFDEIKRVEDVFSVYNNDSEISRINRLRKNEKFQVSRETLDLISKSLEYSKLTGGAFDITVKPLIDLWAKAGKNNRLPSDNSIKETLSLVGYENIALDGTAHTISFKKDGMAIDLGGVAKGYATDRAIKVLKDNGVGNVIVNSGGDMYCLGKRSPNELWTVGVQNPRNRDKIFADIRLRDKAVDTSGDYEKYFVLDGKRYSHIIDPKTGYPVPGIVVSASVIADNSMVSDIMATALVVLGPKGIGTAESISGIDAIVVFKKDDKFFVKMTDGINNRYVIKEEKI